MKLIIAREVDELDLYELAEAVKELRLLLRNEDIDVATERKIDEVVKVLNNFGLS